MGPGQSDIVEALGRSGLLLSGKWGIEREALRVDADGRLAATDHPFPHGRGDITVDFAENQVEFVTKPSSSPDGAIAELRSLHAEAYEAMGDELLWPLSAPGLWDEPDRLRPARFGGDPGREGARRYRERLLSRYGRARQAISGVHVNFSFSRDFMDFLRDAETSRAAGKFREDPADAANRRYMDLARNAVRYRFLLAFLFSASPSIDPRFEAELRATSAATLLGALGSCGGRTASLRLGPLGYRLDPGRARRIGVRFASLDEYLRKLDAACSPRGGKAPLLDSASEYYVPIRPKAAPRGEKGGLGGLRERGIEYLELRVFDLDPFEPLGIGERALAFTQAFALACLLEGSPPLRRDASADDPLSLAASACSYDRAGRPADARIRNEVSRSADGLLQAMERIAPRLGERHEEAVAWARRALAGTELRSVDRFALLAASEGGGLAAGLRLAREHKESILGAFSARKAAS